MTPRHKRLGLALAALACTAVAVALVLNAFRSNIVFFYSPSDVRGEQAPKDRTFRLGGLVETDSVVRQADGVTVRFAVTDTAQRVPVQYRGILPDLFKEGKGVIAQGRMEADGLFHAQDVLAKHDENYMPPEAADALERARKAQTAAHPVTPPVTAPVTAPVTQPVAYPTTATATAPTPPPPPTGRR